MKIFLTGHDGFIGQHLVQRLETNHELEFLRHDLREHEKVRKQVLESNPEIIVHLAARTEVEKSFYEQTVFSDINYTATVNLIEVAKDVPDLKNFVFASTMEVYGWTPVSDAMRDSNNSFVEHSVRLKQIVLDDNHPNPNAPYAVAKYGCEKYLEYAHRSYGFPFTALRQTNCYGRKDNDFFVVEQIITQMLRGGEVNLGYSKPYRNFIYIDDLIDAWQTVIENPEKVRGEIYTLGPNNPTQISDLADIIANKIGWKGTLNWNTKPERPGEIYLLNSTGNKIYSHLGWEAKVSLDEGLDRTIAYWKHQLNQ